MEACPEDRSRERREAGPGWTGDELHGGEDRAGEVERGAATHQQQLSEWRQSPQLHTTYISLLTQRNRREDLSL